MHRISQKRWSCVLDTFDFYEENTRVTGIGIFDGVYDQVKTNSQAAVLAAGRSCGSVYSRARG